MQKYYRLLTTNSVLFDGSIISAKGLEKLKECLESKNENSSVDVELVDISGVSQKDMLYYYVPANEIGRDLNWGEKNVFYDHNGNEYYN